MSHFYLVHRYVTPILVAGWFFLPALSTGTGSKSNTPQADDEPTALVQSAAVCSEPDSSAGNLEPETDPRRGKVLAQNVETRTPGADTNFCLSWEVDMTSDPNRRQRLAMIQGSNLGVSTDGGDNFTFVSVASFLPPTHTSRGDGSAAYDAAGRLWVAILGNPNTGGGWDVFVSEHSPVDGSLVSGPVNVTDQVGLVTGMGADKPWIAADATDDDFSNRLYVVWSVTGGGLSGDWEIWGAVSSNQGVNWNQMTRNGVGYGPISPMGASDGRCWAPHVAVAGNGDVHVTYHGQPGFITVPGVSGGTPDGLSGLVVALRSTDGGATFPQRSLPFPRGAADTTWNSQSRPGAIGDARFWTIGTNQGWILPNPDDPCELHVVTTDDPNDDPTSGDAADVVMATSTDCGLTWSAPQTVNGGPSGSWQVLPRAAIDPITGAIAVTWYDNRDAAAHPPGTAGNSRVDVRARYSNNGGQSWFPSLVINDQPIDPDASTSTIGSGVPATFRIGEYNGVAFSECTVHMVWAGDPVCGGGAMNTYYDRDPQVADLTEPEIFCPDDVVLGCNDSVHPDDTGRPAVRDACDADPRVSYVDQDLGGSCPPTPVISNIKRIWSTTDAAGNFASCSQLISIQDFDAPVITAPPPLNLECSADGGVPSSDPAVLNWLATAGAVDDCSDVNFGISGVPDVFPVGCDGDPTWVTFSASDLCGNSGFEVSPVTIVDTVEPEIESTLELEVLWPPDHDYVCFDGVLASANVTDVCTETVTDLTVECFSSQCDDAPCSQYPGQDGDGDTIDDCTYDPVLDRLCARAERAETNPEGRVYQVELTAKDDCGNEAIGTIFEIFVPRGCDDGDGDCIFADGLESGNPAAWTDTEG